MERESLKGVEGSGREQTEREKQKGEKWELIEKRKQKKRAGASINFGTSR